DGAGVGRRRRVHGAAGPGGDRRFGSRDIRDAGRVAVHLLPGAACGRRVSITRSRRPPQRPSSAGGAGVKGLSPLVSLPLGAAGAWAGGGSSAPKAAPPAGPPTLEVARVVERPVDITLDMPGELEPYETVAVFPKVTGFLKAIRVDRGSHVRAGATLAELEAPELVAQRAEAMSKLQAAEAQLAAVRSKADGDASTYDRLKAAAATPGVVAGNDLVLAQKTVEASLSQVAAAERNVDAARQALNSV